MLSNNGLCLHSMCSTVLLLNSDRLLILVTHSYSNRPFLCTLEYYVLMVNSACVLYLSLVCLSVFRPTLSSVYWSRMDSNHLWSSSMLMERSSGQRVTIAEVPMDWEALQRKQGSMQEMGIILLLFQVHRHHLLSILLILAMWMCLGCGSFKWMTIFAVEGAVLMVR